MQNDIKTQLTGYEENEIKSVYDIPGISFVTYI